MSGKNDERETSSGSTLTPCIYCKNDLREDASEDVRPSLEHIIQYSIGGSNAFSTRDVCRKCNSALGETVDADFLSVPLIGFARLTHDIEGYGGTVPDVTMRSRSVDTSEPAKVSFKRDAKVDVRHEPVVVRQPHPDGGEEFLVAGSPEQAREIAAGLFKKAAKSGRAILTESGRIAASVDDLLDEAVSESSERYRGQFLVKLPHLYRGFAKVAFGFAHVALGSSWTYSPASESLRRAASGAATDEETTALIGGADPGIRTLFTDDLPDTADHVVCLLLGVEPPQILVSLFGGQALTFTVKFDLGGLDMADLVFESGKLGAVVDPIQRATRWLSPMQMAGRFASLRR